MGKVDEPYHLNGEPIAYGVQGIINEMMVPFIRPFQDV
jgi:hypothetical protein